MSSRKKCSKVERIAAIKYLVADSIKDKSFDSEYILGEEIVLGQKPTCFPFPDLDPLPTGPSEKFLEMMAAKLRAEEDGDEGDDDGVALNEADGEEVPEGIDGIVEDADGIEVVVSVEETGDEVTEKRSSKEKKVKLKVVSRHFCMKRIHCVDTDDCRCRHEKFFSVKRVYKRPDVRLRPSDVGPIWRLVHPHLSRVYEVFENKFWIWIVEEVIDGVDVITTLQEMETLSEFFIANLSRHLLLGLKAMHDYGIVHHNLTPNNIIFDQETQALKITDTCLNRLVGEQAWRRTMKRFPGFQPPEMMLGPPTEDLSQDLWSTGILIFMMLTLREHPFVKEEKIDYKAILKGNVDFEGISISKNAKDFISKLLVADPRKRLSVDQALKHPWVDIQRALRSDVDIKVKVEEEEKVEEEVEEENNCGCDISGQSSFDEDFDSDEESCHCDEPPWDEIVRIGINGLNFCGMRLLKMALKVGNISVCAVNDPALGGDIDYLLYLLKSDSTRGPSRHVNVTYEDSNLVIPEGMGGGKQLKLFSIKSDTSAVPWARAGVEYVFDCTGDAKPHLDNHFKGGAKRVVVAGSDGKNYPNLAVSHNFNVYDKKMKVMGTPGGVVHCLLPLMNILNEEYGIHEALVTEIKSMGEHMLTVDGPTKGKSWRLGRGAAQSIIPAPSEAGRIIGELVPEFKGKVKSSAMYVPSQEVGIVDATFVLSNGAPWDHLEETLDAAAAKPEMEGVFVNIKEELVSSDFRNEVYDCNLDFNSSLGISETFVKLVAWFDNEGTKFRKALDLVQRMALIDKKNVKRVNKGPTPGQMLYDKLALTEATQRPQAVSLDAGRATAKQVSFTADSVAPADPLHPSASGALKNLIPELSRHRETAPGALLTGEFGFKPVAEESQEATPENGDAGRKVAEGDGDGAGSKRPSMA